MMKKKVLGTVALGFGVKAVCTVMLVFLLTGCASDEVDSSSFPSDGERPEMPEGMPEMNQSPDGMPPMNGSMQGMQDSDMMLEMQD